MTNFYRLLRLMTLANRQRHTESITTVQKYTCASRQRFSCSVFSSLSARAVELEYAIHLRPGSVVDSRRGMETFLKV